MTDYLSNLPVELIDKILDDIPSFDILKSLCRVNKRLRLISIGYSHFQIDFSYLKKKKNFDIFCAYLSSMSSQIVSISFSSRYDVTIPDKIGSFFLHFNMTINTFSNVRSLSLSRVDRDMWESIKNHVKSFVSLTSLSIDVAAMYLMRGAHEFMLYLLKDLLFISSSLKHLCLRMIEICDIRAYNLSEEQVSSIEHLILTNIYINLSNIYAITPSLHTLDTTIDSYCFNRTERFFPPQQLRQLSIKLLNNFRFSTIKRLLYQMARLVQLTIIAYNTYDIVTDGFAWEHILTNIITFKFLFSFHQTTWIQKPIELESFSTPFWLESKHWYIQYDRCTVSGFSLLYTTPYIDNSYPWEYIKGPVMTKSTGPQILSFPNIDYLSIDSKSPTNAEILCRFTKLQKLFVRDTEKSFNVLLYDIVPYVDISKITRFSIDSHYSTSHTDAIVRFLFSMSYLRSIYAPIAFLKSLFIYRWPNINQLIILFYIYPAAAITEKQITSDEINTFYYSFNCIEHINFDHNSDVDLVKLLNNIPATICSIAIRHPINVTPTTFDGFITREWLEQNTRLCNFFYSCDEKNTVRVWV